MEHIHLHVHLEGFIDLSETVREGFTALGLTLTQEGTHMSEALDNLTAEVHTTTGVMQSALTLIQGIAQRLADAGTDTAKLEELRLDLEQNETALAAAVAANQPPTPPVP